MEHYNKRSTRAGSITSSNGAFRIGGNSVYGEYFAGLIDEVRLYNRALALAEIQTDMNTPINAPASVVNRHFYNRSTSSVFGDGTGNPINAVDSTKSALLPGQAASSANYTNYSRGLNGLVVDVADLAGTPSTADFQFATWDGIAAAGFTSSTALRAITVLPGVGANGSVRIKIEFEDDAIRNTWLRVTMLANPNTGLAAADVFYFGNAVGEMNVGNIGSPIVLRTNASDTGTVRQNQSPNLNSVAITSIYDINKDGRVNATDTGLVRQNQTPTGSIAFFTAPTSLELGLAFSETGSVLPTFDSAFADTSWLEAFQTNSRKNRFANV